MAQGDSIMLNGNKKIEKWQRRFEVHLQTWNSHLTLFLHLLLRKKGWIPKKSEKRTCFTGISDKRWYSFEKQGPWSIQFGQPFGLVSGKREGKLQTLDNST